MDVKKKKIRGLSCIICCTRLTPGLPVPMTSSMWEWGLHHFQSPLLTQLCSVHCWQMQLRRCSRKWYKLFGFPNTFELVAQFISFFLQSQMKQYGQRKRGKQCFRWSLYFKENDEKPIGLHIKGSSIKEDFPPLVMFLFSEFRLTDSMIRLRTLISFNFSIQKSQQRSFAKIMFYWTKGYSDLLSHHGI